MNTANGISNIHSMNNITQNHSQNVTNKNTNVQKSYISEVSIGKEKLRNNILLAPMAGISDKPFRDICTKYGAGLTYSEMFTSDKSLWTKSNTSCRLEKPSNSILNAVQIFGATPEDMSHTAKYAIENGAQIIDINMGCPAKKVCNKLAGSALMKDPKLAISIINSVIASAGEIPVSLKIRTGWDHDSKNAVEIALAAENAGISSITVHGRTREDRYNGQIDYTTIRQVKEAVSIPVIGNGDISSIQSAIDMFEKTKADGIMIGRGAIGKPWLFKKMQFELHFEKKVFKITKEEIINTITQHLNETYSFYGDFLGVKISRKHIYEYSKLFSNGKILWNSVNRIDSSEKQIKIVNSFLESQDSILIDSENT